MTSKNSHNSTKEYSVNQKVFFNLIPLLIPFILLGLLELTLRIGGYGQSLEVFKPSTNYPEFMEINMKVNLRYFSKLEETSPTNDIFLKEKPDSCYRIFVFGGSTTRGFPYQAGTAFPRILYYRLQDAFPNKRIEVVNLSASAISSYSYIDMQEEVLKYEPDLFLVYGGHNEYYGSMGVGSVEGGRNAHWVKKLKLKLVHWRTFQLVQNTTVKIGKNISSRKEKSAATLMQRIVNDQEIPLNSEVFEKGVKQFDRNIREFVAAAQKNNIPVILSELVSNLEDQPPFKSNAINDLPAADLIYKSAQVAAIEGEFEEAKSLYKQSKDLDLIRFRAPEKFNEVVHEIAKDYDLPVVPMQKYFEDASPFGLVGKELMLEHLHPTIDGYFLMADAFYKTMQENKFIEPVWDMELPNAAYYRNNWGFSALDSLIGDLNIKSLTSGWPFVWDAEPNAFLKTYKYTSMVDSMAFAYLIKDERHIEDEHIKLAEFYKTIHQYDLAFEEYFSLIKLHPFIPFIYNDAAECLTRLNRFDEALELLDKAPIGTKGMAYYYYKGFSNLALGNMTIAISDLEKCYALNDETFELLQPLYLLHRAYGMIGNVEKTAWALAEIRKIDKDYLKTKEDKPNRNLDVQKAKELINEARVELKANNLEKALNLALEADKIGRSPMSDKLKVTIYYKQKDYINAHKAGLRVFKHNPKDAENLNNLFVLSLLIDDLNTASRMLKELEQLGMPQEKLEKLKNLYENKSKELNT